MQSIDTYQSGIEAKNGQQRNEKEDELVLDAWTVSIGTWKLKHNPSL